MMSSVYFKRKVGQKIHSFKNFRFICPQFKHEHLKPPSFLNENWYWGSQQRSLYKLPSNFCLGGLIWKRRARPIKSIPLEMWTRSQNSHMEMGIGAQGHLAQKADDPWKMLCTSWWWEMESLRNQTGEVQREVTDKTVGSSLSCLGICPWQGLPEIFPTIVFNEPFPPPAPP